MNQKVFGMAPTPAQMEKIAEAKRAAGIEDGESAGAIRDDSFPDGVAEGDELGLDQEIRHIVYSLHWQYQKQIFDIVQAAMGHNTLQFPVVRRLIMDVSTAQVKTQLRMMQRRFAQEKEGKNVSVRFERPAESDRGSEGGAETPSAVADD